MGKPSVKALRKRLSGRVSDNPRAIAPRIRSEASNALSSTVSSWKDISRKLHEQWARAVWVRRPNFPVGVQYRQEDGGDGEFPQTLPARNRPLAHDRFGIDPCSWSLLRHTS